MKLDGLPDGYIGEIAGVLARKAADDTKLAGAQNAVGDGDAHHEEIRCQALAALAADSAHAVALGVNPPPLEVEGGPLRQDARSARAGKGAHLVEGLPRVLLALQPFRSLGFRLLVLNNLSHLLLFSHK